MLLDHVLAFKTSRLGNDAHAFDLPATCRATDVLEVHNFLLKIKTWGPIFKKS